MVNPYGDRARARAKDMKSTAWLKLMEGETIFRVLPTPESKKGAMDGMWIEYGLHRDVGPTKTAVRCGKDAVTGEGECWLCDVQIPKLIEKRQTTRAALLEAKKQTLFQVAKVIVRDDDTLRFDGPLFFTPSKTVAADLLTTIIGNKRHDFTDPKKGRNITISRTGTGRNDTRYGSLVVDSEESTVPADILKKLKPFTDLQEIPKYSEAKQKAAYQGRDEVVEDEDDEIDEVEEDDEEEDEEEIAAAKASKKAKTTASAKKGKKSPPPEDEEDEDEDDEEEDEPAPPKKGKAVTAPSKGKKTPLPVEDEDEEDDDLDLDDDDEDEEDEEDEVVPPKKGKTTAPAKKGKQAPPEEDEDGEEDDADEDEEDDDPKPPPKKTAVAASKKGKKAPPTEDDEEEEDDAEEDASVPPPKKKGAPPKKGKK